MKQGVVTFIHADQRYGGVGGAFWARAAWAGAAKFFWKGVVQAVDSEREVHRNLINPQRANTSIAMSGRAGICLGDKPKVLN